MRKSLKAERAKQKLMGIIKDARSTLNTTEASVYLGVHRWTLWSWVQRGIIKPCSNVNGRARYSIEDLDRLIKHESKTD